MVVVLVSVPVRALDAMDLRHLRYRWESSSQHLQLQIAEISWIALEGLYHQHPHLELFSCHESPSTGQKTRAWLLKLTI